MSTSNRPVKNVVLAVTGASGACYARRFLERASALDGVRVHLLMTDTARDVWRHELDAGPIPGRYTRLENDKASMISSAIGARRWSLRVP